MTNPLFPNFDRALQEEARRLFQQTELGKIVRQTSSQPASIYKTRNMMRQIKQQARGLEVDKYGRFSDAIKSMVFSQLKASLGPLGEVVEALLRPNAKPLADLQRELDAAAGLLRAFGFGVTEPGKKSQPDQPDQGNVRIWDTVPAPPREPDDPNTVWVTYRGRKLRVDKNNPIITGEMIKVDSSNVHSIGYVWNWNNPAAGSLKVRFKNREKTAGGPMYEYWECPPEMFTAFQKAASKGRFVWDRLRVRGTVSGHQKFYRLIGIEKSGYVPRKATRLGPNEWYIPRSVKGKNGNTYRSIKEAEMVQPYRGRPGNGGPNRGTPNRGRP